MPIIDFLERNARLHPGDVSLVEVNPANQPDKNISWREYSLIESTCGDCYRRELTWREFDIAANRFANLLLSRGIKKGDKVAILMMNCIDWLPIYFGILKSGAIAVPMNFRFSAEEISYCADLADISVLVFGPEFTERLETVLPELDIAHYFYVGKDTPAFADNYEEMITYCSSHAPAIEITDEDDGAIYFSSGTTGFPKAILHRHKALVASCEVEQKHHSQTRDDVFLCIPPLYHTGAKMHWFGSLLSGSKAVILRGIKPEWILQTVSDEKATIVWLLVPWAQDILDAIERGELNLSDYRLSQWRLMHIGAQPVPPSLIKRWKEVFPNHEYDTNYGLSESIGPGAVHLGVENIHKVGAIGIPGYKWEIKIVNEEGNEVTQGEVGELCLRGDGVMKCYYKNPEATREILTADGWLYTGDMAKQDEEGFIYLVDRKKDVIITGGENIYPVQIEDFLRAHDKVSDVGVIGLPDERLGEITAAIIQLKDGMSATEEEFHEYCMALPRYKRPKTIILADIPRNATGKIQKNALRERYGAARLVEAETTK
ncbi:MAG: acyl--CoA ligase [Ruminococcaceae bacterium]|nr:acyl--CoA ligase [Oscillospiraceae bacterium]